MRELRCRMAALGNGYIDDLDGSGELSPVDEVTSDSAAASLGPGGSLRTCQVRSSTSAGGGTADALLSLKTWIQGPTPHKTVPNDSGSPTSAALEARRCVTSY